MAKDTYIHMRVSAKDKELISSKARAMFMDVTEYLTTAGVLYEPSEKIQSSLNTLNEMLNYDPIKELEALTIRGTTEPIEDRRSDSDAAPSKDYNALLKKTPKEYR